MSGIVVFYDPSFPYAGVRPGSAELAALERLGMVADAESLAGALPRADGVVLLHGPYFPKGAWLALHVFLQRGGGLLHMGGAPFRIPVYRENGIWHCEHEQTAYHQQLNIHEVLLIDPRPVEALIATNEIPLFKGREALFAVQPMWGFVMHATNADDQPGQGGTSGPMDAHLRPLLHGVSRDGRRMTAPAVLLENTKGPYAGGRWLFINLEAGERFWTTDGLEALRDWSRYCIRGVTEIWFKPSYACYRSGEQPSLTIQLQDLSRRAAGERQWSFDITVSRECADGSLDRIWTAAAALKASPVLSYSRLDVPVPVEPGYYEAVCLAHSDDGETCLFTQGYWGFDTQLLEQGDYLSCGRDYFQRQGKPVPVVGMTYMASDVARKFLFLPNVSVWKKDMEQMMRAGINLVRTGIWTAWRQVMFVDGHPYEEVLRAIDAFLLTAKKYGLEVTFTFFAFTPEAWEGINPYLDPRSTEAQKRFIASIVSRHAASRHVHWDLINEPTLFNPLEIFGGPVTVGDAFEQKRYARWLKERHDGNIRLLQERWNMTPDQLPDFDTVQTLSLKDIVFKTTAVHPKKNALLLDYTLFTMDMHNEWVRELSQTIRSICPHQMITVGQDEGICSQRPSPFFYAGAVDYTTVHSWWQLDHLVWDGIFAKTPGKPNLVQETGIMYVETPEGKAKRTEVELKHILERKYAYAFSTGGAGAVQWIWNTNYYMDNINESNIGALRADGTEKPEADISYDFGRFMAEAAGIFGDRALEETAVVFPYSNDFSSRKLAMDATTALTRVMAYHLKQPFRGLGEYHLEELADNPPRLVMVPSAHNISTAAFDRLLDYAAGGGVVLVTGALGLDEYWRVTDRSARLLGPTRIGNVRREEVLELDGCSCPVSFGTKRITEVSKEEPAGAMEGIARVVTVPVGSGKLIWCPLPVELNVHAQPLERLYRYALKEAAVKQELNWLKGGDNPGIYGRKLELAGGFLFIFVSESAAGAKIAVEDPATGMRYSFLLEPERTVMFATDGEGGLLAVYRPGEVTLSVEKP